MTATVNPAVASLISVVIVSSVSTLGVLTLSIDEARIRRLSTFFVSFAVGALLGDAFLHLVPESFGAVPHDTTTISLLILAGMLLFFVVEKLLRHGHGALHRQDHGPDAIARPELVAINIAGDAIHNFIDGVLIGASWLMAPSLGLATTVAVVLHEIPQELGDFGVLVRGGLSVRRAVLVNVGSASVAILGTLASLLLGSAASDSVVYMMPITAGAFVYLAAADLIPELQHDRSFRSLAVQTPMIALGIAIMGLLTLVE